MRKLKVIGLQFTVILTILIGISFQMPIIQAKDASPSASLSPIQQKLEDLKEEIASKAAQIKTEISQKISNKAYVGIISQIQDQPNASASAKIITLTSPKGTKVVSVNDFTTLQDATNLKKAVTIKSFSQGDFVSALGDVDDKQVLTAKKLVKSKPIQTDPVNSVWGQIQSVSPSTIFIVNRDNKKVSLTIGDGTDFRVASDEANIKEVVPGNFLVSIGSIVQNSRSVSDFIYLINPNGDLKIIPTATPSASPTATPSATLKKK